MRWIFLVLIVLPLWACSEKEEITENYAPETIEATQEAYQVPKTELTTNGAFALGGLMQAQPMLK